VETIAGLKPSFAGLGGAVLDGFDKSFDQMCLETYPQVSAIEHVHHAGNSSGVVDGAAAVLYASQDYLKAHGLKPRARVVASSNMGDDPTLMLNAPVPSARKILKRAGMTLDDIDLIEINEAFAPVPLLLIQEAGIDPEKVNVNGGAIALGHPLGATGAMLIGTVLDELERRDQTTGLVTMCIGMGMGIATIIERV
jgi:acetyl-CoA C-acetyltransferase